MIGVSVCVIAKNEEKNIKIFLERIRGFYESYRDYVELLILDTGSTDATISLAETAGARVEHFEWVDDFSAARNEAMRLASYDMILFLDADEFLENIDFEEIQRLLETNGEYIGRLERRNLCNSSDEGTCILVDRVERLIDRRLYCYKGSIHEQVTRKDNGQLAGYPIPLTVYHEGYMGTKQQLKDKALRNNKLLYKELEKNPNEPYIYYQLGQSYSLIGDKDKKIENFKRGYQLSPDRNAEYTWLMIVYLGNELIDTGRVDEAIELIEAEYQYFDDYADFLCMAGGAYIKKDMYEAALRMYKRAYYNSSRCHLDGANSYRAAYNIGCIYEAHGAFYEADKYYRLAGDFCEARLRLAKLEINKELYFKKQVSLILYIDSKTEKLTDKIIAIENQSIGMGHIELIVFVNVDATGDDIKCIEAFECSNEESVILIKSQDYVPRGEAYNEALMYASADAVVFIEDESCYSFDAIRCLIEYLAQSGTSVVSDDVDYQNTEEFMLRLDEGNNRQAVRGAGILRAGLDGKIYRRDFLERIYPASYSSATALELEYADQVYCLKKRYRS